MEWWQYFDSLKWDFTSRNLEIIIHFPRIALCIFYAQRYVRAKVAYACRNRFSSRERTHFREKMIRLAEGRRGCRSTGISCLMHIRARMITWWVSLICLLPRNSLFGSYFCGLYAGTSRREYTWDAINRFLENRARYILRSLTHVCLHRCGRQNRSSKKCQRSRHAGESSWSLSLWCDLRGFQSKRCYEKLNVEYVKEKISGIYSNKMKFKRVAVAFMQFWNYYCCQAIEKSIIIYNFFINYSHWDIIIISLEVWLKSVISNL